MMNTFLLFLVFHSLICIEAVRGRTAHALILGTKSNSSVFGNVAISDDDSGVVTFVFNIKGLASATKYGVHIHQWGQLSEDGMTSGSHYNPLNRTHSCPSSDFNADSSRTDLHVGDIVQDGGLTTDSTGALQDVTVRSKLPSLNILDPSFIIGRTIIIHERLDDCTTQPTGNSGKRIAQGVIGATDPPPQGANSTSIDTNAISGVVILLPTANFTGLTGYVVFSQDSASAPVTVTIKASGLPANSLLGWHIHESGNISDTVSGLSTKLHFNPLNATHGCFINETRHAGDLDNLRTDASGTLESTFQDGMLSLQRGNATYIMGRAVVIHTLQDQCIGATGNAGGRAAIGVIGYRNVSAPVPALFSLVGNSSIGTTATGDQLGRAHSDHKLNAILAFSMLVILLF